MHDRSATDGILIEDIEKLLAQKQSQKNGSKAYTREELDGYLVILEQSGDIALVDEEEGKVYVG